MDELRMILEQLLEGKLTRGNLKQHRVYTENQLKLDCLVLGSLEKKPVRYTGPE